MSQENNKAEKFALDESIVPELRKINEAVKEHKREKSMAERRIKMGKLKVHDIIETMHPELADKCYSVDFENGVVTLDCDCDDSHPLKMALDKMFGGK
jgi:hypothetical protein